MKILYIIESLRSGGKERRLVELIKGLSKYSDIEMELVLTREDIHYTDIFDTGIKIHAIEKKRAMFMRIFMIFKFFSLLKSSRPDIIHVWGHFELALSIIPAKLLKIKLVNSVITTASPDWSIFSRKWIYTKLFFKFSDVIVSNSYAGLQAHHLNNEKCTVVYNGLDINRLNKYENSDKTILKKKMRIDHKFIVLMIANITEKKDFDTFLKAAIEVINGAQDVLFISVGDYLDNNGNENVHFKEMKNKYSIDKNNSIIFSGKQRDVIKYIKVADICLLTSYSEGISNSIMEYMALSKPVICTKVGGTPELVEDNVSGYLIDNGDNKRLAELIFLLMDDPNKMQELGKNGRNIILERFPLKKMITDTLTIYNNLR